ncbi:MAG TPA: GAF domain-containing sensor histidine kinase [Mycobacteriales bacterium]
MTTLGAVGAAPRRPPARRLTSDARSIRVAAGALAGVAVALAAVAIGLHLHNGDSELTGWWYGNAALTLTLAVPAYLIATRRPANPVGWLLCAACLTEALCAAGREYLVFGLLGGHAPGWLWTGWFTDSLYIPAIVTLPLTLMLFPDGRAVSPRFRALVPVLCLAGAVGWASYLFTADTAQVRGHQLANPAGHLLPQALVTGAFAVAMPVLTLGLAAAVAALVVRYRRAEGEARDQVKWVAWAGSLAAVEVATEFIPGNPFASVTSVATDGLLASAIAVAILRHRVLDVDVVINRTLVFVLLTAVVVGGYVGFVAAFAAAMGEPMHFGAGLLATALLALLFAPLRHRLQLLVDRAMYGERRNPYGVMTRLGASLEPRAPRAELAVVVDTVTRALKLPYVAIVGPDGSVLAASGAARGATTAQPLVYQGRVLGELRVQARTPAGRFGRHEQQLLTNVGRQVAIAVHAVQLSSDLQESRRRLVTAKEEERRRLRRDLHDGLGPQLAAVGLQLDAARSLVAVEPDRAADSLATMKSEIRSMIEDVRRLVYELRPPALDELGLVGAMRDCGARLEPPSGLLIEVCAAGRLPSLPAAVEVAAYRIVSEALTNTVRHAAASRCEVELRVEDGALVVCVRDDGTGLRPGWRAGVGTQSMAERAAEIGGTFRLAPGPDGCGTVASARLPIGPGHE